MFLANSHGMAPKILYIYSVCEEFMIQRLCDSKEHEECRSVGYIITFMYVPSNNVSD